LLQPLEGEELTTQIRDLNQKFNTLQENILKLRSKSLLNSASRSIKFILCSAVTSVIFLLLSMFALTKQLSASSRGEKKSIDIQRGIIEGTNDLIVAIDLKFNFIAFNKSYLKIFEEVTGKTPHLGLCMIDALSKFPGIEESAVDIWNRSLKGAPFTTNIKIKSENSEKTFEISSNPILDEKNNRIGAVQILRDITGRIQRESALEESEERFRNIMEYAPVGIAIVSLKGKFLQVNKTFTLISGYNRNEAKSLTLQSITYPEDLIYSLDIVKRLLNNEINSFGLETRYLDKNGEIIWVQLTISLLKNISKGVSLYFVVHIENISARKEEEKKGKRLLQKYEKSNAELEEFAFIASHDLKSPLIAIQSLIKWILKDPSNTFSHESQENFSLLNKRAIRMSNLIDGILEYSRIGRTDLKISSVSVKDLLLEIIETIHKPKEFLIILEGNFPTLMTPKVLLVQVFSNLISNAIKYHDRTDGKVKIGANDKGDFWEFYVSDDGPGIDPAYHQKIFELFQTLQSRDTIESTGIGLSIVKKILHSLECDITIESSEGKGAIFRFAWPKQINSSHFQDKKHL
jgi:PAS domain S-box-containing protein